MHIESLFGVHFFSIKHNYIILNRMKKIALLAILTLATFTILGFYQKPQEKRIEIGKYSVIFPSSFSAPQKDTTFFESNYGKARFIAAVAQHKKAACMAGMQEYTDAAFVGVNEGDVLDSLQQQIVRNMSGKVYRQFKVKKNGKLMRTTYFSALAQDSTTTFWRFELLMDSPNVYQIAYTSSDKSKINSKEAEAFFKSLHSIK